MFTKVCSDIRCALFHIVKFGKLKPLPEILLWSLFRNKCKSSHSLVSPYNVEILKRYDLHELTEKQLFQLLLQNDPYLLPEVRLTATNGR